MKNGSPYSRVDDALEAYGRIAEEFSRLFLEYQVQRTWSSEMLKKNRSDAFLFYTLKMEEGYCRAATGLPDELEIARQCYSEVVELFPDAPIGWLRLGQVSSKLKKYSDAVTQFKKSLELAGRTDKLEAFLATEDQVSYLRQNVYRLLGYAYWRIFREGIDAGGGRLSPGHLSALVSACEATTAGFEFSDSPDDLRLLNNLVYYFFEVEKLPDDVRTSLRLRIPGIDRIQEMFDSLVASIDLADAKLEVLDTIVAVGPDLGRLDIARNAAERVFELIHGSNAEARLASRPEVLEKAGANAFKLLARDLGWHAKI